MGLFITFYVLLVDDILDTTGWEFKRGKKMFLYYVLSSRKKSHTSFLLALNQVITQLLKMNFGTELHTTPINYHRDIGESKAFPILSIKNNQSEIQIKVFR